MVKSPKKPKQAEQEVELVPDAWPKFEQFIRDVSKAGPQHRKAKGGKATAKRTPAQSRETT